MAITTYSELKDAVADLLDRDDLTTQIPTFISLAEASFNRGIRHWRMEARTQGSQSSGDQYMQIPSDWIETMRMHVTGNGTTVLDLASMADIADKRAGAEDVTGRPTHYAMVDSQFELYPTPDADYTIELLYIAKIPVLSDSNTSNWLLDEAPDLYLYGAALHSAPLLQEDERLAVWGQMYGALGKAINSASKRAKFSGSGLRRKVKGLG